MLFRSAARWAGEDVDRPDAADQLGPRRVREAAGASAWAGEARSPAAYSPRRRAGCASNPYGGGAGGFEITEWTVVADPTNQVYYVRTYENPSPQAFDLKKADPTAKDLEIVPLNTAPAIQRFN